MKNKKLWVSILAGILAAMMLLSLLAGLLPTEASAALTSEKLEGLRDQINDLEDQQAEIQEEIDALRDQINDNMSEMEKLIAEKTAIDQEIGLMNQQILNVNEQIATYSLLIADKQDELDAAEAHLEELRIKNKERVRAMEEEGSLSYWSVLFKASSFADLLDRLNMIEEIAAADQRRLEEMRAAAQTVAEAQSALETEKEALEATKAELAQIQAQLEVKREEADAVLVELHAKGEEYEKLVDEAEADEEELLKQIAQAEKEYNAEKGRLEEEERKRQEEEAKKAQQDQQNSGNSSGSSYGSGDAASSTATWVMPCWYVYLSSPYGWRLHPVYGDYRFHSGVDLAAPAGTPIYATRSGTVTRATYDGSAGYYVTINHGDGFSSTYMHMTHYVVSVGQKVSAGQVIGEVGSTGTSTGNHLHFGISYNGATQNPAAYINFY